MRERRCKYRSLDIKGDLRICVCQQLKTYSCVILGIPFEP